MAASRRKTEQADDDGLMTMTELAQARTELAKELGMDLLFGDDEKLKLKKLPLGIATLDKALSGGFAYDRVTLIIGQFSAGKTVLAMLTMRAAQLLGQSVAFIDVEKTWTPEWAEQLGIKAADVIVIRPPSGEKAFDAAVALVRRKVGVVVIDSLAALRATAEIDVDIEEMFEKQFVGTVAKLVGRGLTMIENENKGTLVLCINQIREKPGVSYGSPETIPGGKAQEFVAWQIVRVRRGEWILDGTRRIGYMLKISVQKNKQGAPWQEAQVPFYFTGDIDEVAGIVEVGLETEVIRQKGAKYWIKIGVDDDGQVVEREFYGRSNLIEAVRSDAELKSILEASIDAIEQLEV